MHAPTYALDSTWRALLKDMGLGVQQVMRLADLPDDLLERPGVRLAPQAYYRFWRSMELLAQDELMALRLVSALRSEALSPPLFATLCSANLLVAARRLSRYKSLVGPMAVHIEETGEHVRISLSWDARAYPPPASLVVAELLFLTALGRMGTREQGLGPLSVTTRLDPPRDDAYERFLGTPVQRGERDALVFARLDATHPFLTANEALWSGIEPTLHRAALALGDAPEKPVSARVRTALVEGLPAREVGIAHIAARLTMNRRTMQRALRAEGASFQGLVHQTRLALAHQYLQDTALPIAEIAFLLGFDEPNSFYRAFRRWTGTTPERARQARECSASTGPTHKELP